MKFIATMTCALLAATTANAAVTECKAFFAVGADGVDPPRPTTLCSTTDTTDKLAMVAAGIACAQSTTACTDYVAPCYFADSCDANTEYCFSGQFTMNGKNEMYAYCDDSPNVFGHGLTGVTASAGTQELSNGKVDWCTTNNCNTAAAVSPASMSAPSATLMAAVALFAAKAIM